MDRRRACKQRPQVNSPDIVLVEGGAERADHMRVLSSSLDIILVGNTPAAPINT